MRLFVAVTPPEAVLDRLVEVIGRLRGGDRAAKLRWADRAQMHVTLRFLGEVAGGREPELIARLDAAPLVPTTAVLGPAVTRLGRQVLVVPVDGLDALAAAVTGATGDLGRPPDPRPFTGHVTLARAKGRRGGAVPRSLTGTLVAERWPVGDVRLVRSHLAADGARYEDLHIRPLTVEGP